MTERGKFLVYEGPDACGKATQAEMVQRPLEKRVGEVLVADFPRYYDSVWGKLLGTLLSGEHGDFISMTPYLTVFPYMVDQYTWSRDIGLPHIEEGGWVLSNRYFTSNVHQVAKMQGQARDVYRKWLWDSGYEELGILKPDLVLFLDVPPTMTRELNTRKQGRVYLQGGDADLAESNFGHQEATYREYLRMVKNEDDWVRVACVTKGELDTPEVIHKRTWQVIENRLL